MAVNSKGFAYYAIMTFEWNFVGNVIRFQDSEGSASEFSPKRRSRNIKPCGFSLTDHRLSLRRAQHHQQIYCSTCFPCSLPYHPPTPRPRVWARGSRRATEAAQQHQDMWPSGGSKASAAGLQTLMMLMDGEGL